jgi:hypothetical protein
LFITIPFIKYSLKVVVAFVDSSVGNVDVAVVVAVKYEPTICPTTDSGAYGEDVPMPRAPVESKPTYTTPVGKEVKIDPNSKSVSSIRNMDNSVYIARETRISTTYAPYYGRPVVVYNDPYNSFFWYWMLDRSLDERAMWAYHHRAEMDDARYREMLAKDARLESRIRELEVQNKGVRDTSYTPPGLDPDLQYTDDYVDSIMNPHEESSASSGVGAFFFWLFMVILVGLAIWLVIWLVFLKNW